MRLQNIKIAALPKEHGAYGFTIEPLLLALLASYSQTGLYLAIGTLLIFFAHQPIKILWNHNKGMLNTAFFFLAFYGICASILLYLFLSQASFLVAVPLYLAIILMIFYLVMDLLHYGRHIIIEIIAPAAISLIAVSIVLNAGWDSVSALGLWMLLAARFIPTPFYIRSRLQLEKNLPTNISAAILVSILSMLVVLGFTMWKITPWLGFLGVCALSILAWAGLSPWRKKLTVRQIGMREFFYGQVLVLSAAGGYYFSL